jgi:hypothetical protein
MARTAALARGCVGYLVAVIEALLAFEEGRAGQARR